MVVCSYFLEGECVFGYRCTREHPEPQPMPIPTKKLLWKAPPMSSFLATGRRKVAPTEGNQQPSPRDSVKSRPTLAARLAPIGRSHPPPKAGEPNERTMKQEPVSAATKAPIKRLQPSSLAKNSIPLLPSSSTTTSPSSTPYLANKIPACAIAGPSSNTISPLIKYARTPASPTLSSRPISLPTPASPPHISRRIDDRRQHDKMEARMSVYYEEMKKAKTTEARLRFERDGAHVRRRKAEKEKGELEVQLAGMVSLEEKNKLVAQIEELTQLRETFDVELEASRSEAESLRVSSNGLQEQYRQGGDKLAESMRARGDLEVQLQASQDALVGEREQLKEVKTRLAESMETNWCLNAKLHASEAEVDRLEEALKEQRIEGALQLATNEVLSEELKGMDALRATMVSVKRRAEIAERRLVLLESEGLVALGKRVRTESESDTIHSAKRRPTVA